MRASMVALMTMPLLAVTACWLTLTGRLSVWLILPVLTSCVGLGVTAWLSLDEVLKRLTANDPEEGQ